MSDVVFILGAGASKLAGAPLMADFLDVAHDLWKLDKVKDAEESFKKVFDGIGKLQAVHSKSNLDIDNIESVFTAFEMANTLGKFPDYDADKIPELIDSIKTVIVKTIEQTLLFPTGERKGLLIPEPYDDFVELLKYLRKEAKPHLSVSVITFNYDMAVDFALHRKRLGPNYSLEDGKDSSAIKLHKLHGSLNWAYCKKCNKVVPWDLNSYFRKYSVPAFFDLENIAMPIGTQLKEYEHCDVKVEPEPVLVPPTWDKSNYHKSIEKVWSAAAKDLGDASNIFIIGYSLPETDLFFRYLYSLGTVGQKILQRFWVFNPDVSVKEKFEKILGPGAKTRFKFFGEETSPDNNPGSFTNSIDIINEEFSGKSRTGIFI